MRKQAIRTGHTSGELVVVYPNEDETTRERSQRDFVVSLVKPDVVKNKKIDGYRKPSSYSTTLELQGDSMSYLLPGACTFFPEGPIYSPNNNPNNGTWGFRGSGYLYARRKDWTFPKGRADALRTKVRNNVRNEILDVGMVIAEIAKTAATGAALMSRIGRSMQAVLDWDRQSFEYLWDGKPPRDGNGKVLKGRSLDRFNRQTAAAFLEWKYGIMPTVYDLQGVTKALDISEKGSLFDNPPLAVGRAVERYDEVRDIDLWLHEPGGLAAKSSVRVTDRVTHKARLDYRVKGDAMRGLNRYGLGLSTLPTILWDKTPFSFVFDMVVPIAEIIKAWGALAGVSVVGYCETLHVERSFGQPKVVPSARYPKDIMVIPRIGKFPCFHFERKAFATPPLPMPHIRNPATVGNMASVLALFTQIRPKKKV